MECPEPTRVALFVRGELPPQEVSTLESHLDGCERCLGLVADAAGEFASGGTVEARYSPQQDSVWVHLIAALAHASGSGTWATPSESHGVFGPYVVTRLIGHGGMGVVYAARHEESGAPVAIKTVIAPTTKTLAAMRQEIAFLRSQRHPGVVQILEDGVIEGDPWYAMELLEGRTLDDFNRSLWAGTLRAPGQPPAAGGRMADVIATFVRLCAPLSFVHRAGIVHCDLKPANVFLRLDGQPVLMDFGLLSRAGGAIGRETLEVGGLRGTLPYLAPELVRGRIPDSRADLYALGCMLYESATGRAPFVTRSTRSLLEAHLYATAAPPSSLVTDVPPGFDDLIASLLAKVPEKRIAGADMAADMLESLLDRRAPRAASKQKPYLFRPRLVGRDALLAGIQDLRREAEAGSGHVVLIGGESGIGKTFFASECAHLAMRAGLDIVTGECSPVTPNERAGRQVAGGAFGPLRNLLQRVADRYRSGEIPSTLFETPRTMQLLARYEPTLEHLVPENTDELPTLPPAAERERALDAMNALLGAVTVDRSVMLVLDDIQWADDLSLAFLESLTPEFLSRHRVLVLALYRSDETTPAIARLRSQAHVHVITLARLDEVALTTMAGDLLSQPPHPALMQAISRDSEGNPFFVAEYLRAAASEGLLVATPEGWSLAETTVPGPLPDLPLPRSLHELLDYRIRRLGPEPRAAAEIAAVFGRQFRAAMVALVAGVPEAQLEPWIEEMVEGQLVERTREGELRFAHDKIRELAYAGIGPERLRKLHLGAAEAIERAQPSAADLSARAAELAYHFESGGAPARAVDYFETAAEHALKRSANADSVLLFRRALELSTAHGVPVSSERRALWARRIGDALQGLGDLSGSRQSLLESLELLGHPMPASGRAMGAGIFARISRQARNRLLRRGSVPPAGDGDSLLEAARAYDRLMQVYYYRGEYGPLFFANLATLDLAERAAPSPTLAVAYTNAAATAGIIPLRAVADLYFRLAETTLESAYDPEADSYYRVLRGNYLCGLGRWLDVRCDGDRVMELADGLGFRRRWEEGAGLRSTLAWGRDFAECLLWTDRLYESAVRRADAQTTSWGHLRRAEVHLARGAFGLATTSLEQAEAMVSALGMPEQMRALSLRAYLQLVGQDLDAARRTADRAEALIAETKTIHFYCVDAYSRLAEVRLAGLAQSTRKRLPAQRAAAAGACRTLQKASRVFPVVFARYCLHEGSRLAILGKSREAIALWRHGVQVAAGLDVAYDEALLLLRLAEHRDPHSPRAASRAAQLLKKLEAPALPSV